MEGPINIQETEGPATYKKQDLKVLQNRDKRKNMILLKNMIYKNIFQSFPSIISTIFVQ